MAEKIQGRPWQPHEDALLLNAIHNTQGDIDWRMIAQYVPDRTNKACRKRWLHSLCPTVKKTAWTQGEDGTLLRLYELHGPKWALIARAIPGRTDDACSKRYREALDPSLKRDEWTSEEDARLVELQVSMRGKWGQIGPAMGRSGLGCRNRWRLLERKRTARNRATAVKAGPSGYTDSNAGSQAGPSTLPPVQSPPEQQLSTWGEDILSWDAQYQSMPTPSYSYEYEHTQPGSSLSFYPSNAGHHNSSNDYNMHTLSSSFASDDFLGPVDFTQSQPTHQQPQRLDLARDYRASAPFEFLSTGPLVSEPRSTDQTYVEAHDHVPEFLFNGTFVTRILDSQIDPALTRGFDDTMQTRPLPHYPPRVVSASQQIPSPQHSPSPSTSPMLLSAINSPHISPATSEPPPSAEPQSTSESQVRVATPDLQQPSLSPSAYSSNPMQSLPPATDAPETQPRPAVEYRLCLLDVPARKLSTAHDELSPHEPLSSPVAPHTDPAQLSLPSMHHPTRSATTPSQPELVSAPNLETVSSSDSQPASQNTPADRTRKKPFLSAFLPASSDPAVLAYACGMSDCWPNVNYATSSELAEHMRTTHSSLVDMLLDSDLKPYRCSLAGCNKSWKSLNGLQYHLQVSRDHFRQALASAPPAPPLESQADGQAQKKGKKTHPCTYPGCTNVYKQLAGLRYHLKHGHPTESPAQLEAVPPTLAKKIGERQARKAGLQVAMASSSNGVKSSA